jgi:hypothetical protein
LVIPPVVVDGMAGGRSIHERIESEEVSKDPARSNRNEEIHMKKYVKPSLKGLGLLRAVTKYSVTFTFRPL